MFQEKRSVYLVRLALSVLAGSAILTAQAQEVTQEKIQRVEVTGSNIKRINTEAASAVQVVNHKEILQSGATTITEVLSNLSASTGALSDIGGGLSFGGGGSGVALRNLGKNSTLILVNGRRIAPFALADGAQENFTNVDSIPTDIIERIEILKDGASAIYGSDAIAGVINIITKKEFTGVSLHADAQGSLKNKKIDRNQQASMTVGYGDLDKDNYNVYAHIEAFHRNPYVTRDIVADVAPWYKKYVNPTYGDKSSYAYPGNFMVGAGVPAKSCPADKIEKGLCRLDTLAGQDANPESDRLNFLSAGRTNLSKNISAYAEVSYSKSKTKYAGFAYPIGTGASYSWFDTKNNVVRTYDDPLLPKGNAFNPYDEDVRLRYRFADNPDLFKQVVDSNQYRVLAGLEGTLGAWDFNTALGLMGSKTTTDNRYWPDGPVFLKAIESGEYKFGGVNSAELLNRMFPNFGSDGDSKTTFFDAKANRELMPLAGGALAMAVGIDLRRQEFHMNSAPTVLRADTVNATPITINGAQNLAALFVELNAPVTKALELNGALRLDKVSGVQASIVPKFGAKYIVSPTLLLRGTAAEGFRAPNVAEAFPDSGVGAFNNGLEDPKRCATGRKLFDILMTGNEADKALAADARDSGGCNFSAAVTVAGNKDLKPEKARSFTTGFVFEPSKSFSVALDYFNIERRDEITTPDITQVIALEDTKASSLTRQAISARDKEISARAKQLDPTATGLDYPIGSITTIKQAYGNLFKTKISGIDVDVNSQINLDGIGKLRAGLEGTYLLNYAKWDPVENGYVENLVGNYQNYRVKAVAKFALESGPWTTGVRVNYFSGTNLVDDRFDGRSSAEGCAAKKVPVVDCMLPSDVITDLSLQYSGFKNTNVVLNVRNIFDHTGLLDLRSTNYNLVRGRIVKIGVEYKF